MIDKPAEAELHAYIDGELDAPGNARIEDYLARHPDERERMASYQRHKLLVRQALEQISDEDSAKAGTDRLAHQLAARLERPRLSASLTRIAAGVALFVAGALTQPAFQAYQDWRLPPMVEAAAQAHQVFSDDPLRPVELPATSKSEMVAWFAQHLGSDIHIPDLTYIGQRFVGGRLLASSTGPMAQLLYEDRYKRRLSIYLSAQDTGNGSEVEIVKVASFSAGYWQDGELTYTIVAEMEAEALLEVASEINGTLDHTLF